ncbi:MAG: hypothetical protein GY822_26865 [Deltaproteobacteria bacterium]|nr:hypothetical protein [Deltaproteobacteria bacterium]
MPAIQNQSANIQALQRTLGNAKSTLDAVPANADAIQLINLLKNNQARMAKGSSKVLSKAEGAWLLQVAGHPKANAAVKKAVAAAVDGFKMSSAVARTDLSALLDSFKTATDGFDTGTPPPAPGGISPGVPSAPGGAGTNEAGVSILDVRVDGNTGTQAAVQTNPLDFKGESTFAGDFKMKPAVLASRYDDVDIKDFGSTNVQLPGGGSHVVKDLQYDLGDGKVGMRFMPVGENGATVKTKDGQDVPGHQIMDDFLREEMGLSKDDPIYALIAYVHPEGHTGDMKELAGTLLKTEMGATHMGAYTGKGITSNSPEDYHSKGWAVEGYPANVQIVSLDGVDQATLNKNAMLVDSTLNDGVKFPNDYKNDKFRTVDINTTLFFYKEWVNADPNDHHQFQKAENTWKTYCAEHKTIVTNTMLNLPHNEASFKEVLGDAEGAKTWKNFKAKFETREGRAFKPADETSFEPLWKKEGLKASDIKPWDNLAQYEAYDNARHSGTLDSYTGPQPLQPGKGMAWAPETTADLVNDFTETYAAFKDVGGPIAASTIMGFKDTAVDRMGIDDKTFIGTALPVINKIMVADAMVNAPNDPGYAKKAAAMLYMAFGGAKADLATGNLNPQLQGIVEMSLSGVKQALPKIMGEDPKTADEANVWLQQAVQVDLDAARKIAVSDPSKTQFYSPPAVSHRVAIGMHESSSFVNIKTVCTAIDKSEIDGQ